MTHIEEIQATVHQMKEKLDLVFVALVGNDLTKDGGVIKRLLNLETELENANKKIEELERANAKSKIYVNIIWGACGIILSGIVSYFFNNLTAK